MQRTAENILLVMLGLVVGVILLVIITEVFLRFQQWRVDDYNGMRHPGVYKEHPVWNHHYKLSYSFDVKDKEFNLSIKTNNLGFRGGKGALLDGSTIDINQSVLLLGDSFMFGMSIPKEKLLVNQLANKYPQYSFYNLSSAGWGTYNELRVLEYYKEKLNLKKIIIAFFENDFLNNEYPYDYHVVDHGYLFNRYCEINGKRLDDRYIKPIMTKFRKKEVTSRQARLLLRNKCNKIAGIPVTFYKKIKRVLHYNLLSYDLLEKTIKSIPLFQKTGNKISNSPSAPTSRQKDLTRRLFIKIKNIAKEKGSELYVLVIPSKWRIEKPVDLYIDAIDSILTDLNIKIINPSSEIRNNGGLKLYWEHDGHLTPRGHQFLVDAVEKKIAWPK